MAKRWQKSELTYLKRYAKTKTPEDLAGRFNTDVATVRAKLAELGVVAAAAAAAVAGGKPVAADPLVAEFSAALESLHRKEWAKAAKGFEQVAAGDEAGLAGRARQFLAVCRQRLAAAEPAPGSPDPYLEAVVRRNEGNTQSALEICRRGGRDKKDDRFAYLAASIHALENRPDEAAKALAHAIELNAKNRIHAYHDADFAELRRAPEHRHLFSL